MKNRILSTALVVLTVMVLSCTAAFSASAAEFSDPAIPADFENDLWLQYDYKQLNVGETIDIYPRRVPQIVGDLTFNDVFRPNFNFTIIEGDSIALSTDKSNDKTTVTALKDGTTKVMVTYDEAVYLGVTYGACSPVNTAYVVFDVDSDRLGAVITTDISERSYDTIYFNEGVSTPYSFTANAGDAQLDVTCNGIAVPLSGGVYTANLENKSNVLGFTATKDGATNTFYKVIDARKVEILVENTTTPDTPILIGDAVNVSFKGITHPIYKLADLYNPTWRAIDTEWDNTYGTYVAYNNDIAGEVLGLCDQFDLATRNTIPLTFTQKGDYTFSSGRISTHWWGSLLGSDKAPYGDIDFSLGYDTRGDFSNLPDFTINVLDEISTNKPVTGITFDKTTLSMTEGDAASLLATVLPADATDSSIIWKTDNNYFATVDQNGVVTAKKAATDKVPNIKITATTTDGEFIASCIVTVKSAPIVEIPEDEETILAENKKAAASASSQISGIGGVSLSSEAAIKAARTAYNALSAEQKALVPNLQTLISAEKQIRTLKLSAKKPTKKKPAKKKNTAVKKQAATKLVLAEPVTKPETNAVPEAYTNEVMNTAATTNSPTAEKEQISLVLPSVLILGGCGALGYSIFLRKKSSGGRV